ncbi:hypothetical protein L228DRAFT_240952 [Xylona heveae TC161]|uniref:Protein YAE1 n=1 Tax=Xylona heveae (strain CBS 132557 / TC161) TaxID=1328760 RepID=A0A165AGF0_XYLHT|nr:hypothetical protein L228DRAFT_240952 [Xylona heveae TC161]KZF20432.1 hypothetical protein L228DRAFT_240952 [Xylona heveae TC161]
MDDDVFYSDSGSPPPSFAHESARTRDVPGYDYDLNSDFLDTVPSTDTPTKKATNSQVGSESKVDANAPSDIPRLRSVHSTAGYRDGIAFAKNEYIQAGFDEGYALGAVIGLRIGWILGALEGLWIALEKSGRNAKGEKEKGSSGHARRVGSGVEDQSEQQEVGLVGNGSSVGQDSGREEEGGKGEETESKKMRKLLDDANEDLKTENVFGKKYFGPDGIWLFDVVVGAAGGSHADALAHGSAHGKDSSHSGGSKGGNEEANGVGEGEYTFEDVASSHPLVKKWTGVVIAETQKRGVALDVFEGAEYEARRLAEDGFAS